MKIPQTEAELREWLAELIYEATDEYWEGDYNRTRLKSFAEAGVLTTDEGLVLRFPDGEDFCLTIQRRH